MEYKYRFRFGFIVLECRFRFGLTNLYSIDEYKNQSLLFYLKYFVLYELMHNPTPSFAEEQILFSPLK